MTQARMPPVETEVVLWGEDPLVSKWLAEHQIKTRPFTAGEQKAREVILVGSQPPADAAPAFVSLAQHIARGSTAIFLAPEVFKRGDNNVGWLPLANKGSLTTIQGWLYLKDEWAKRHPIFDGLPAGGLMDYTFYREIIPDVVWMNQEPPAEAVAGAIKASQDYSSGLMVSVYPFGAGRFILNTLLIRENLGSHPAAERLLRNLLRSAARDLSNRWRTCRLISRRNSGRLATNRTWGNFTAPIATQTHILNETEPSLHSCPSLGLCVSRGHALSGAWPNQASARHN